MNKTLYTVEEAIDKLIEDDREKITNNWDIDWVLDYLREGFVGYRLQTRDELESEMRERFGNEIIVRREIVIDKE